MKKFLEFVSQLSQNRYEVTFHKLMRGKNPCALFAPSWNRDQKSSFISQLKKLGVDLQTIFSVNPDEIQNPLSNVETLEIDAPPPRKIEFVFLPRDFDALIVAQRFLSWKIEPIIIEFSGSTHETFDFYLANIGEIFRIYQSVIDEESRDALLGYILQRISRRISFCKFAPQSQYLLTGFLPKAGDFVIDVGACDGATSAMFTDLGCRAIAFEMDHQNFSDAKRTANSKGFAVENLGLADYPREVSYRPYGGGSSLYLDQTAPDGSPKTRLTTLDLYVREKKLPRVDFIKMDIEGSELSMLKGAADTLTRFKPILAISAYHKPEDLWTLIDFVSSVRPDYEFAFRHFETTSDNAPFMFFGNHAHTDYLSKFCQRFGLPMRYSDGCELVLFAR